LKKGANMENYIEQPLSNPQWDPSKGDFYSESAIEEDKMYKRKLLAKNTLIGSLVLLHLVLLVYAVIYFS